VIGCGDWAADRIVPDAMRALGCGEPIGVRNPAATRPWQHVLEPLSGYLCLAERLSAGASLADAFHFGPLLEVNHSVRELVEEALRHWPGTWIDQNDAKAPHEASLLNLLIDKAHHQLGWATLGFRHHRGAHRGLVPARGGRAGLSAGALPGRSGEPCGHAHPVMGACCCAA
jgi:CDP-glucose 4,6-dehydratase